MSLCLLKIYTLIQKVCQVLEEKAFISLKETKLLSKVRVEKALLLKQENKQLIGINMAWFGLAKIALQAGSKIYANRQKTKMA